jgi:type II secretory pathway pseudopilin PulG
MLKRLVLRARSERGDTLVEVLMTMAIMAIAFVGILSGLATAIRLGGIHRGQANADVVLTSAAESVKNQTYVPCPAVLLTSYNPTLGVTLPSGWSSSNVTVTAVQKWNGTTFQASCPATDQGLELITVTATTPDGKSTESIDVIKRVQT